MKKKRTVSVNLGCGANIVKGWLNIDNYYFPDHPDFLQADIRRLPLASESVDYVLCDNVLEHLAMADVPLALFEIRRILKPKGRAVIIVPNFREIAEHWMKANSDASFDPYVYKYSSEEVYGNQVHEGEYHRTPFSVAFLNYSLHMVGFHDYKLIGHAAMSPIPQYPGVFAPDEARCRHALLVADITKEL